MTEFRRLIINRVPNRAMYPQFNGIERLFRHSSAAPRFLTLLKYKLDALFTGLVHSAPVVEMLEGC